MESLFGWASEKKFYEASHIIEEINELSQVGSLKVLHANDHEYCNCDKPLHEKN
jgi:hypothetical protein